jgi:hypothetical protein
LKFGYIIISLMTKKEIFKISFSSVRHYWYIILSTIGIFFLLGMLTIAPKAKTKYSTYGGFVNAYAISNVNNFKDYKNAVLDNENLSNIQKILFSNSVFHKDGSCVTVSELASLISCPSYNKETISNYYDLTIVTTEEGLGLAIVPYVLQSSIDSIHSKIAYSKRMTISDKTPFTVATPYPKSKRLSLICISGGLVGFSLAITLGIRANRDSLNKNVSKTKNLSSDL